ncbi:hypothetical protein B0H13DRAFT_1876856 [Mycena leptocephala]|nr:hypothetical protein B0H13DRAFT_1876856 [Mycena leptocephala]
MFGLELVWRLMVNTIVMAHPQNHTKALLQWTSTTVRPYGLVHVPPRPTSSTLHRFFELDSASLIESFKQATSNSLRWHQSVPAISHTATSDANTSFRVRSWTLCHSSELDSGSVIQAYHLKFASVAFFDLDSYVHERRGVSFWLNYVTPFDSWLLKPSFVVFFIFWQVSFWPADSFALTVSCSMAAEHLDISSQASFDSG